jgi:acetyltransferase
VAHERLTRICFNDYDREIALVVEHKSPRLEEPSILGVGRLSKLHGTNEAEFALLVSDAWHGLGLGEELLKRLIAIGREEKLDRIVGQILSENQAMQHICKKIGFEVEYSKDNRGFTAIYNIK